MRDIAKQSSARARNGDLSTSEQSESDALRVLGACKALDVVMQGDDDIQDVALVVKQMMVVHLTVRCARAKGELRAYLDVKSKTKSAMTSPDDPFVDTIENCAKFTLESMAQIKRSRAAWTNEQNFDVYKDVLTALFNAGSVTVKVVMDWFWEDRKLEQYLKRSTELGGLTLPRALSGSNKRTNGPSSAPSIGTSNKSTIKPLTDSESLSLDLVLHEISQILSVSYNLNAGLAQAVSALDEKAAKSRPSAVENSSMKYVSALVKLDELWLTHNVTKAVTHATSWQNEPPVSVNSVAEDTFHVVSTCFARAVHSHSEFVANATANHVAGFMSDGFYEILNELIRKEAPANWLFGQDDTNATGASLAAAKLTDGGGKSTNGKITNNAFMDFDSFVTGLASPHYFEALNTMESAINYCKELRQEMQYAFEIQFGRPPGSTMAPTVLEDGIIKMYASLKAALFGLTELMMSKDAFRVVNSALDPRVQPYEMTLQQYEGEGVTRTNWVANYVDKQFRANTHLRACIPYLSHSNAMTVLEIIAQASCRMFESTLDRLKFTALGALQFDKDVRNMIESIVNEEVKILVKDDNRELVETLLHEDAEATVRLAFKRLRHWAFLLNLECASDNDNDVFLGRILTDAEVDVVLNRRSERNFFLTKD